MSGLARRLIQEVLECFQSKEAAAEYLRLESYSLRENGLCKREHRRLPLPFRRKSGSKPFKPLALPILKSKIFDEIQNLPPDCLLAEHGNFSVYYSNAEKIPNVMLEIGRLREETFRATQEGTGQDRDLDDFDAHYLHLFMWNTKEGEIAGCLSNW